MSWATCYSGSNNINFNSPPIMADSRIYSSWQPEAVVNKRIRKSEGIKTNWQYRQFLQKNGTQIINYNTTEACYYLGLECRVPTDRTPSDNVPYTFKNTFDTGSPGFGYCNSDLKNPYLTTEQLNARMVSIHVNPESFTNNNK